MTKPTHALGADIGGSHISTAVINLSDGSVVSNSYTERKIDPSQPAESLLNNWSSFLQNQISRHDQFHITQIGIGIPGEFDYENGIALYDQNKFTQLYGINIKEHFLHHVIRSPEAQIEFVNDASAFALGEHWCGAAKDQSRVLMLTLGTGLGATFLIDGLVKTQGPGIPVNGTLYDKRFLGGIADEYFSTRFIVNGFNEHTTNQAHNAKQVAEMATSGDTQALAIFNVFGENLAVFLKPYITASTIDLVVLGGNIALAIDLFGHPLKQGLADLPIRISPASLGSLSPIIGAASLFTQ